MKEKAEIAFRKLSEEYNREKEYEESLKIYRDNYAIFETERSEGFAEGEAKGRAEGRVEGFAESEAKGRAEDEAKGRAEGEAIFIKRMMANGKSISAIAEMTGYSPEEIDRLTK